MKLNFTLFIIVITITSFSSIAQEKELPNSNFNNGLSFYTGLKYVALKDEFISKEKYSGITSIFMLDWTKDHEKYKFHLSFDIMNSAKIKNFGISAEVTELSLNFSYLYPIGKRNIFSKNVLFSLGPMPELFIHYRNENIAKGGNAIFDAYSFGLLISVGPKLNVIVPISEKLFLENNFCSNIISFGGKYIDPRDKKTSMVKLLTLFSGQRASFESILRSRPLSFLSVSAGYKFNLTRMNSWDYFISANDNIEISITYLF